MQSVVFTTDAPFEHTRGLANGNLRLFSILFGCQIDQSNVLLLVVPSPVYCTVVVCGITSRCRNWTVLEPPDVGLSQSVSLVAGPVQSPTVKLQSVSVFFVPVQRALVPVQAHLPASRFRSGSAILRQFSSIFALVHPFQNLFKSLFG
ncbi:unnamed protein product [Ilex paraguariensis]|uniref:Uncharacterized protein n=1 Tax=Ilex paraguariensis TaxID=185542 RepID=A0ABC8UAW9_9AQUA